MSRLLLVGSGPGREYGVQTLLRLPGLELVVADGPIPTSYRPWADEELLVSFTDWDRVLKVVAQAHKLKPFAGVMTFVDTFVPLVGRIAEQLTLVGPSFESASTCVNKLKMRQSLAAKAIPVPRFRQVDTLQEAAAALDFVGVPAVIKPVDSSGSHGVVKVCAAGELEGAFAAARANTKSGYLLLEEFMAGPEFSIESITAHGCTQIVAVTDKWTTSGPFFVEVGHAVPSLAPEAMRREIGRLVVAALEAVGLDNSPSHTEVKWTPEGPKIVEIGPRLGGDNISRLVDLALGVNLVRAHAAIALGLTPEVAQRFARGAAIRFLTVPRGSQLDGQILPPSLNEQPPEGLVSVQVTARGGDIIQSAATDPVRVGHVITQAADPKTAMQRAMDYADRVRLAWKPL